MRWLKLPMLKLGEYDISETGPSTATKMTVPSTAEEKTCKKNDVKARSLLLMALPNEHQLTFDQSANHVREEEPKKARENNDAPIIKDWVSDDEDDDEPNSKDEKKSDIPTVTKKEFVKPKNQLGGQLASKNLSSHAHKHMAPKAVLMKTGLKSIKTARPVNTVRARDVNAGLSPHHVGLWRPIKPNMHQLISKTLMEVMLLLVEEQMEAELLEREKGIKREYSVARTPQQNGVAERKNMTLIEAARTMIHGNVLMSMYYYSITLDEVGCKIDGNEVDEEPSHASEVTQVEDQEIELGNILQSYAVPTTPHTRIQKDHPIDHVIGDVQSSVQTRRMTSSYSELGFLSAIYEGKTHKDLHTCLFACFLSWKEPKRVSSKSS
ncbi:putative ribonuclease H-like domain-containing protein [Tanacetum coccineum]